MTMYESADGMIGTRIEGEQFNHLENYGVSKQAGEKALSHRDIL